MPGECQHIIKLGGSLLDVDDLPARFNAWWASHADDRALLLVGGGPAADLVRAYNAQFGMSEDDGHWAALHAMQLNAQVLAAVFDDLSLVTDVAACESAWSAHRRPVVDPVAWLRSEQQRGIDIPHRWSFTSDSIAAHLAKQLGAPRLTLLKSAIPDEPITRSKACEAGLVDGDFAAVSADIARVELVNLRCAAATMCMLQ